MKRLLMVSAVFVLVLMLSLTVVSAADKEVIRVASNAFYPPFEMIDPDETIWGFDIELIVAVVEEMGAEVQIFNVGWDGLIPGIQSGAYDLLISAMTITPERAKQIDFSDWYFDTRQAILVRQGDSRISSKADLAGKTIGVQSGTTGDFAVSELEGVDSNRDIRRFEDGPEAIMELMTGGVDVVVIDMPVALYYRSMYPRFQLVGDPQEWDPEYMVSE